MAKHAQLWIANSKQTHLSAEIQREGERSVDILKVELGGNVNISENQIIEYVMDKVDLTNLTLALSFERHVKDESGNQNDGTATAITYADGHAGQCAVFNGSTSFISFADASTLNFNGAFEIWGWIKNTQTTKGMILSKRSSSSNGIALFLGTGAQEGRLVLEIEGVTINGTTAVNDDAWHVWRIKRDSDDNLSLEVDGSSEGTDSLTGSVSIATSLLLGKDYDSSSFYSGSMDTIRAINGGVLSSTEATKIVNRKEPVSFMKFGGRIRAFTKEIATKKMEVKSYGKELGEQEVRGLLFENKSPEAIVQTLITDHTNLTFVSTGTSSGVTLEKFVADGKLLDVINDLTNFIKYTFRTDALQNFILEPLEFKLTDITMTHGSNCVVYVTGKDDTELVNDLTILGENKRYQAVETFDGDASTVEFTLNKGAVSIRVLVDNVEQTPEDDYSLDSENKKVTFTSAPASGTDNVQIEYEYEAPLYIRGTKPSSITTNGRRAKRFIMPWIRNQNDGVRFVSAYLNAFKDLKLRAEIIFNGLNHSLKENDIITVVNSVKSINATFVVKSVIWHYPTAKTKLKVGEFSFNEFETHKQIIDKLHDLESALTVIKDINEFRNMEEILALTDSIDKFSYDFARYKDSKNYADGAVYTRIYFVVAKYANSGDEYSQVTNDGRISYG